MRLQQAKRIGWLLVLGLSPVRGWGLQFYTDPFLQATTPDSVTVVWITDEPGDLNQVEYGPDFEPGLNYTQEATTTEFTRLPNAYRHQAVVTGLTPGIPYSYRVSTDGLTSDIFTCRSAPSSGGVRFLLTSDAQGKPLVDDTMQAVETYGGSLDAILFAGDLVDAPDETEEWWDGPNAFLDVMTGRNSGDTAPGGKLMQNAPLFPALGNHEYQTTGEEGNFDAVTYQEMFTLPAGADPRGWYSFDLGNTHIVTLTVAQYWDSDPDNRWIFEEIKPGSDQYNWLVNDLASQTQDFTVVQFHNAVYTQGHSAGTPFDWPLPADEDQIVDYLVPLFNQYGVDLVLSGHDHVYEHFYEEGIHYLQSSHIGNTYGLPYSEEPHGKTPVMQLSDPDVGYFTILDTTGLGTVTTYRNDGQIMEQFSLHSVAEKPDLWIQHAGSWWGDDVYNGSGDGQTARRKESARETARFRVRLYNDGDETETFFIQGPAGDDDWTVEYYRHSKNVTDLVTRTPGWRRRNVPPAGMRAFRIEVTPSSGLPSGSVLKVRIRAEAQGDPTQRDVVKAVTKVR